MYQLSLNEGNVGRMYHVKWHIVGFQNYTFLECCNLVILHHTVSCLFIRSNVAHNSFQGIITTTLNVYIKLCIKLIISTCKKLSGLIVHQGDLGHHHPLPWSPHKISRKISCQVQIPQVFTNFWRVIPS